MPKKNDSPVTEPVELDSDIADHRSGSPKASDRGLVYPFAEEPEGDTVVEVAEGIFWARVPLPMSLGHINVYLIREPEGWTVIDTGLNGSRGMETWQALEKGVMAGLPIVRVIATHLHPDHLGLAGWLVERHGAEFVITLAEFLTANTIWLGASAEFPENELTFLFRAGVDPQYEDMIRSVGFGNFKKGVYKLPPSYRRIEDGNELEIGGRRWRVLIGRGHSPEHACLLCLDEPIMIAGDQVLPRITSNVSVHGREPEGNPLAHWLASLDRFRGIAGDPLVLPAHGKVFRGLHTRLDALIDDHLQKLQALHARLAEPRTCVGTFPALFKRKITGFDFFMALGEAMAHLNLLRSVGLASRTLEDGVHRYRAEGQVEGFDFMAHVMAMPGVPLRPLKDFE